MLKVLSALVMKVGLEEFWSSHVPVLFSTAWPLVLIAPNALSPPGLLLQVVVPAKFTVAPLITRPSLLPLKARAPLKVVLPAPAPDANAPAEIQQQAQTADQLAAG